MSLPILFAGQPIFGSTATATLTEATPPTIQVSGSLLGETSEAVSDEIAVLQSFAGLRSSLILPPGEAFPGGQTGADESFFSSSDLTVGSVTGGGSAFAATISVTIHAKALSAAPYPSQDPAPGTIPPASLLGNPGEVANFAIPITLGAGLSFDGTELVAADSGGSGPTTLLFSCLACTPVENTSTATSVFGSPTNANGSLTIPVAAGNVLRWALTASYSCTGSDPSISASVLLGGSPILVSSSPPTLATAVTNQLATSRFNILSILTGGEDATASGWSDLVIVQSGSTALGSNMIPGGASPASFAGFNGASNVLFDIQIKWSAASPSNSFQITSFKLFQE
jgi:hypothetical protein